MSHRLFACLTACLKRVKNWFSLRATTTSAPAAAPVRNPRRTVPTARSSRQNSETAPADEAEWPQRVNATAPAAPTGGVKTFILYGEHPMEVVERRRRDGSATRTRFFLTVGVEEPRAISFDHGVFVAIGGEERCAWLFVPSTDLQDPVRFRRAYRMLDQLCARIQKREG